MPVVPDGTNTTTTSFFTPPMDPSRLADHLFDPVSGVRVDARGQRIPPGMVPQIVFDPTLGRPVQLVGLILSFNDKMFLFLQLLLFLDVQGFLKVHLLVHHL